MANTMQRNKVQLFLDDLGQGQWFDVIFLTQKGEQRRYSGRLIPSDTRSDLIPFETDSGDIKSFHLDRVLSIQEESE